MKDAYSLQPRMVDVNRSSTTTVTADRSHSARSFSFFLPLLLPVHIFTYPNHLHSAQEPPELPVNRVHFHVSLPSSRPYPSTKR
jgi:hypothetical protein